MNGLLKWLAGDATEELEGLRFAFNVPFSQELALALLAGVGLAAVVFFWPRLARLRPPARVLLVALRAAAILLILFLLLDPCVTGKRVRRTERAVLLLFDDSRSMQVGEYGGSTRARRLLNRYEATRDEFEKPLRARSQLVFCRFGELLERIRSPRDLVFEQDESDLLGAVEMALSDFQGANVAAVVLFSDGVQQTPDRPLDWKVLERLDVPVYTVGVGSDAPWRDLAVGPVAVKRTDVDENPTIVNIPVRAAGLAGREIVVEALLDGSVIESNRLTIDGDSSEMDARLEFVLPQKGWLELEVRARLASASEDDALAQNNARRLLVDNREQTYRILYLGGRPNWENKFIRRALEEDEQLKLTSLVRISGPERTFEYRGRRSSLANPIFEGTEAGRDAPRYDEALFLRLGTEASELDQGYPERAEELFPYHLVVWGEIEAEFFSQRQLELTREYVRKRGGALLLLGGRDSFTEGGYEGTLIERILPVRLRASEPFDEATGLDPDRPFRAQPTLEGQLSGAWSLHRLEEESQRLWNEMAPLYRINAFALTRPGASVHANAASAESERTGRPLFAIQRYGEGHSAVLATGATWQWRMRADPDDRKHERLWRQIVRSLARQTPEPVRLRALQDVYVTGKPARFEFTIRDKVFDEREGLNVTVMAQAPSGNEIPLAVEESIQETGLYACEYVPQEAGTHKINLSALDAQGQTVATMEQAVLAEPDRREFQRAQYDPAFLRDIARRTGGAFLPLDSMAQLPERIRWQPSERAEEARVHLWRFPGFYFALAGLLIVEWYLRRRKGYR